MLWQHHQLGIISFSWGERTQSVIFIFVNPSGHLQLTRFFFWLRQPDSIKVLLAYVFHCDAEYLNSKRSEKGSSTSCPFHVPAAMSLGWFLCMQKVMESQRESILERVSAMKCSKHEQQLSMRFKGIWHSLGIVNLDRYFRGISFCLHDYTIITVQLDVYIYEKDKISKEKQFQFLTKLVKVSDWVKKYAISSMFHCSHYKLLAKMWKHPKLVFKCVALYYKSILKHWWVYLQFSCKNSLLGFKTQALELYGKHNRATIQCFLMVLVLKALLEKSECFWDIKSCTAYKHKVYK